MICTSKCDEKYLDCVAACSDSNCLLDCNRASNVCYEGWVYLGSSSQVLTLIQLVHATLIVSKVAKDATTPSAFAT